MKVGDKVMVPRTGGGKTPGEIVHINPMNPLVARVKFICGPTYRGEPAPEGCENETVYKTVPLDQLKLIEEKEDL